MDTALIYGCAICGATVNPRFIEGRWQKGVCECYRLALATNEEFKIQARRERHAEIVKRMNMRGIYGNYQIDNFDAGKFIVNRKASNLVKQYVRNLINAAVAGSYTSLETRNLILYSDEPGVGKTMLAAGVLNALINEAMAIESTQRYGDRSQMVADRVASGRFFLAPDLTGIKLDDTDVGAYGSRFESYLRRAVWVIDDVGKDHIKESWRWELYWDIMEYRLTHCLPTIITTNLNPTVDGALQNHIGKYAHDRIMEQCVPIFVQGGTHRMQNVRSLGFGADDDEQEEPTPINGQQGEAILPRQIRA